MLELAAWGFAILHINLCGRNAPYWYWHRQPGTTTQLACAYDRKRRRFHGASTDNCVYPWLMRLYKCVVSNEIVISLHEQSQFMYRCGVEHTPTWAMSCHRRKVLTHPAAPKSLMVDCGKGARLQAWNPRTFARQVSRLAARHKTVHAWMKDEGKHGRCNAAGHKAITPTLKIIHKGQSSFMASFLDKNKGRGRRGG